MTPSFSRSEPVPFPAPDPSAPRSQITSHVLDAALGRPAAGVAVALTGATGELIASAVTDSDGRIANLGPAALPVGSYALTFATGEWFTSQERATFYPTVRIDIAITQEGEHYHVPLLLGPWSYSTYRGS